MGENITNLAEVILIALDCPSLLPMVTDVSPEIETKATGNNFYDMIDEGDNYA